MTDEQKDNQNNVQEPQKETTELEKVQQECETNKNNWLRALADYQNLQKETAARLAEWAQMSERKILEEFIPVYEHLKLALGTETSNENSWADGVKQIVKEFAGVLKDHGVEEIKTVGEKFDPNLHEAIGHEKADGHEPDMIVKEISGGYKMGNKTIKAAKVIVAK